MEHVGPELIDFYPVDVFVNTACPRIAIDDAVKYAKPMITPYELEVVLGEKKWEDGYKFDEILNFFIDIVISSEYNGSICRIEIGPQ